MKEISIELVRDAICAALDNEFGHDVIVDRIEQGFTEPCFFVEVVQLSQKRLSMRRLQRQQKFCIHFFPTRGDEESRACLDMAEKLYQLLELLPVNKMLCRGTGMNHKVDSEGLRFMVDYNYHLLVSPESEKDKVLMDNLNIKQEVINHE